MAWVLAARSTLAVRGRASADGHINHPTAKRVLLSSYLWTTLASIEGSLETWIVLTHIFSLMYDLLTFQPSSASLLVGVQAQSGRQGGQHLMGEKETKPFQLTFNGLLKVDFQGSRVTSDGGLILVGRLKQTLGTLRPTPGTAVGLRITCVRGASSCILCERDVRIGNSG